MPSRKRNNTHLIRGLTEPLLGNIGAATPMLVNTDANGSAGSFAVFTPRGAVVFKPGVGDVEVLRANMRWFTNQSFNWSEYRVLSASVSYVRSNGLEAKGSITLVGVTDASDLASAPELKYIGSNARTFSLISSNPTIPIPVDTSWKKITNRLSQAGNATPYLHIPANSDAVVPVNTVNDLSFGGVAWNVSGAPPNTLIGSMVIKMDVEFRGLNSSALNQ